MISWRNPGDEPRATSTSTPTRTPCSRRATRSPRSPGSRPCTSTRRARAGSSRAGALGHLAAEGALGDVASLTLLVCALDNERAGTTQRSASREVAAAAVAESARRGLPRRPGARGRVRVAAARTTSSGTTWSTTTCSARSRRRSTSCTGTRTPCGSPPACTATSSASRSTTRSRTPARSRCSARRSTSAPSTSTATSSPALNDHIVPWENAYRSTQLLGGETRFVLSTSGHIQALVNPPRAGSRSSYRIAAANPASPATGSTPPR